MLYCDGNEFYFYYTASIEQEQEHASINKYVIWNTAGSKKGRNGNCILHGCRKNETSKTNQLHKKLCS